MRFIFRPIASYAVHTRKWCRDIAAGIKGNGLVRRVLDGFLIQVTKRNSTAIADVIDLPGELAAVINASRYVGTRHWLLAKKLEVEGNPTEAVFVSANPVFTAPVEQKHVAPSGYVGQLPWPGPVAPGATVSTGQATQMGTGVVTCAVVNRSLVVVSILAPGMTSGETPTIEAALPDEDKGVRFIGIDLAVFGFGPEPSAPEVSAQYVAAFATARSRVGYAAVVRTTSAESGAELPPHVLSVVRWEVVEEPDTGELKVEAARVFSFTESDAAPQDQSSSVPEFNLSDHLPPLDFGDGAWAHTPVGGFRPDIPPGIVPYLQAQLAQRLPWQISPSMRTEVPEFNTLPPRVAVQDGEVLTFIFHTRLRRAVPPVTVSSVATGNPLKTASTECPGEPSTKEVMYRVVLDAGAASVQRITSTEVSATEPATWDNAYAQHYPAAAVYHDGQPWFLLHRIESPSEALHISGDPRKYACPGFRNEASDSALVSLSPAGVLGVIGTPGRYPAAFHTVDGFTGGGIGGYDNYGGKRRNFGRQFARNFDPRGTYETTRCEFACHYAPGMAAVIMGSSANYTSQVQQVNVVVVSLLTGEVVAESAVPLAMDATAGAREQGYVRWHITCLQEGEVDDDGNLTRHGIVLLTLSYRYSAGFVYIMKDLNVVQQACATAAPLEGPVFYLGTPLAPARPGYKTGRSFIAGKPVTP
ncbi:hypothetical protein EGJ23_01675 [Pseudomonas sp. o96-267]|uniref:hypothetical protein n=1 Tax=Pseudomonas sp. o96-267 TaxID=2479853 RepID=UPI000F766A00|nr:hypothetical protein [Pseudomonas sp. o96-267]RRV29673.1 hypothetical protein EGJ23_01675 [Pseudomonas sp. o96-267]